MSTLSLRIPESLHKRVKEIASKERFSINQFIATALAEKLSAIDTENYLEERVKRGDRKKNMDILEKIPDVESKDHDRL